jgi:octaprenyl-diphosphate synthase
MLMKKAAPVLSTAANPVRDLHDALSTQVQGLNQVIQTRMASDVDLINQLGTYIIAAGGKRIRPLLTIAMAHVFGVANDNVLKLAAAVEFIHTATLLHDDVVDASDQRRGQPSANALFGNQASVLVGDFLFSRAFELMVETGHLDVLRILSNASAVIASGEVMQLMATGDITLDQTRYIDVIGAKTAALFAAACEAGAVIAGATPEQINAARTYGMELGIAFQIADDVMDYAADSNDMGKNPGDDFREGKVTLPVVLALADSSTEDKQFWQRCMVELQQSDADFTKAQAILHSGDRLNQALMVADRYAQQAANRLSVALPDHAIKAILQAIPAFAVHRSA